MTPAAPGPNDPPEERYTNSETALGGADAVEKTSAVVGRGADPRARHTGDAPAAANLPSGRGFNPIAWVVGGIAVLIALVYLFGMMG